MHAASAGIPKFYRWLSERYPLLNQFIGSDAVPEIDNLYLDMNGIFHNCTHGNDPGRKLTEEEMVLRIFNYLEKLFELVKPKKLMFMAIDGKSLPCQCLKFDPLPLGALCCCPAGMPSFQ